MKVIVELTKYLKGEEGEKILFSLSIHILNLVIFLKKWVIININLKLIHFLKSLNLKLKKVNN